MSILLLTGLIVVGMVGSFFFSGAEIAVISCNRLRMHHLAGEGDRAAAAVELCLKNMRKMVTTTLLGTNFFNVAAASSATGLFAMLVPEHAALLSTVVVTPLILVFAEIYPKTGFRQYADGICMKIAPALNITRALLAPLVWIADGITRMLLTMMGSSQPKRDFYLTREELQRMIREGERLGLLRSEGRQMIHRTFTFSESSVEDIMVPLVDVFAIEEHARVADALIKITDKGHSRIPVYRERIDNIVGSIYAFDLLGVETGVSAGEIMHPSYYVPESKGLQELILEMKQSRVHQAIVVDEFGGATGIVTLEDALERIVGDVRDEFDQTSAPIPKDTEDWITLDARTTIAKLQRSVGTGLPAGEYKTLGGYLISVLGRIPEAGELYADGEWEFEILEATPRQIVRVRMRRSGGIGEE